MRFENAIIMASGLGTRLRPLTLKTPKPLLEVKGVPMIETVISALNKAGVKHIYVVVGYLKEQFNYLEKKYENLTLIENREYETVNNVSSIYAACGKLKTGNCFICEADLYVKSGEFLKVSGEKSGYFGRLVKGYSDDWVFDTDGEGRITRVGKCGTDRYNMMGFSYFNAADALTLADCIEDAYKKGGYEELFWDDVVNANLNRLNLCVFPVENGVVTEIDTVEELDKINSAR